MTTMGWSGNVASTTVASLTQSMGYDLANRLTSVVPSVGASAASYVYTLSGDQVTVASRTGATATTPAYAFGYDQQGNLSAVSQYDSAGTTLLSTTCLVHDALGRLILVGPARAIVAAGGIGCNGAGDVNAATVKFEYDAWNRRVARLSGGARTEYVQDREGHLLAEELALTAPSGAWSVVREYAWLDGLPLAQFEYPGPTGRADGYVYMYHLDQVGLPRAMTNERGETVWTAQAERPYGDVSEWQGVDSLSGRTVATNLRLPGQYDERLFAAVGISGLQGPYYNWHRWYLPNMGRYMELDPIALQGGFNGDLGPEWYGYASGNPLSFIDPTGLYSCIYRVTTHTMSCWPDSPQNPIFVSDKWTAGNDVSPFGGPCRDNPACFMFGDGGPPPPGKYRLGDRRYGDGKPNWRAMTPTLNTRMYGRFGINTHPCGPHPDNCSTGCLASTDKNVIDRFNQWMDLESDNWITVVP